MKSVFGLKWRRRKNTVVAYWICPAADRRRGYKPWLLRLWTAPDKAQADVHVIAARCASLCAELLVWRARKGPHIPKKSATQAAQAGLFVRSGDLIKIGFTNDLRGGLEPFRTLLHQGCEVLGAIDGLNLDERRRHRRFRHLGVTGEWFSASRELLDAINVAVENSPRAGDSTIGTNTYQVKSEVPAANPLS